MRQASSPSSAFLPHRSRTILRSSVIPPTAIRAFAAGEQNRLRQYPKFGHIESIPESAREWHVNVLNSSSLAEVLVRERNLALLFRNLATLRTDIPLFDNVDHLRWTGPQANFDAIGQLLDKAVTEKKPKSRTARVGASARTKSSGEIQ